MVGVLTEAVAAVVAPVTALLPAAVTVLAFTIGVIAVAIEGAIVPLVAPIFVLAVEAI